MTAAALVIDDLSRAFPETAIGTHWQLLSDAVMGGVSAGDITRTTIALRPAIRMRGDVSLENDGGFLQMALDLAPGGGTLDASGFDGIAVSVLGNGENYGLHLRTAGLSRPWQSYRASFATGPDWQVIILPFSAFQPHRTDLAFDAHRLRRLGIVAIGRAFHADISVSGVSLYAQGAG